MVRFVGNKQAAGVEPGVEPVYSENTRREQITTEGILEGQKRASSLFSNEYYKLIAGATEGRRGERDESVR